MEKKKPSDLIVDGVLSYGVEVGRLIFERERTVVYAVTDLPHIGPSDVTMLYQISRQDYDRLLAMSLPGTIPAPAVPAEVTDACHGRFLCGESAYCKRTECSLDDADLSLAEHVNNKIPKEAPMDDYRNLGYCGVDCFSCPDYLNKVCPSCRKTDWKDGDACMPVKCCREKGIELCAFCGGFPCEDMAEFYSESDGHRAACERMRSIRQSSPSGKTS